MGPRPGHLVPYKAPGERTMYVMVKNKGFQL